jgi:tRNA threonylcarbamoyladenosine biosynthesis protein TsaB
MASILNIETATPLCSVALTIDGHTVSSRETREDKSHAARLTGFIQEIMEEKNLKITDLDAVAVGKGPGSYTGLRIGVSTAKGLCYGAGIPLIAVDTLKILYIQAISSHPAFVQELLSKPEILFCPMIDARRMEVYTCLLNSQGEEVEPVSARIIDADSFSSKLLDHTVVFFGTGMEKCRGTLTHHHAVFIPDIYPGASSLALLAEEKFAHHDFEDIAYFEPFYLKDFIATISKKRLPV